MLTTDAIDLILFQGGPQFSGFSERFRFRHLFVSEKFFRIEQMLRAVTEQNIPADSVWSKGDRFVAIKKGVSRVWVSQGEIQKTGELSFNTHELCVKDANAYVSRICETLYNKGYT